MALPARIARTVPQSAPRGRPGDSRAYLDWIKSLPCIVTGLPCDDPHHLMRLRTESGEKVIKGVGRRHPDRWSLPVARWLHDALHAAGDDEALLASLGFDARALCAALWAMREDGNRDELARRLLDKVRDQARLKVGPMWDATVWALRKKHGPAA